MPEIIIVPPAVESLLRMDKNSFWPQEIKSDQSIKDDASMRRELLGWLEIVFDKTSPTEDLDQALAKGKIASNVAICLYELLTQFLYSGSFNKRIVLYLPFEFMPSWAETRQEQEGQFPELVYARERFVVAYRESWFYLLKTFDMRANFVDGNILEPELSPDGQPRVCKAAHLIPQLFQKKYLSKSELIGMMNTRGPVFLSSVADALSAMVDMSLLSDDQYEEMRRMYNLPPAPIPKPKTAKTEWKEKRSAWLARFAEDVQSEIKKMKMRSALDLSRGRPPSRVFWENIDREDKLTGEYADRIAENLPDCFSPKNANKFISSCEEKTVLCSLARGLGKAIEKSAEKSLKKARVMVRLYEPCLQNLWQKKVAGVEDEIICSLTRLFNLKAVNENYLYVFGVEPPNFDAPISEIMKKLEPDFGEFALVMEFMISDPFLSKTVYPVILFFGSRLKGYAKKSADLDIAVLVRPGVAESKRSKIKELIARKLPRQKTDGKMVQFWLEENIEGKLSVRNLSAEDVTLANETWAHVLLGSVWFGEREIIKSLYESLLSGIIYSEGKKFEGADLKSLWVEEMEREVLQYRLMHRYYRFFPKQGGIKSLRAEGLDPESAFWDSGYRRLATKLFISRIFLPQLEKTKN